jgi:MscS family membrane protein
MLNENERIEPRSTRVRLTAIKNSSFELEVFAYVLATSWETFLKIQEELLLDMVDIVEASGSSLAPA